MRYAVATTAILAAITAAALLGGGGGSNLSNLRVDSNGGTCTRHASPADIPDSEGCSTFDAAYEAAQCGDLVLVKQHTTFYTTGDISATQKNCADNPSSYITFRPYDGETVNIGGTGTTGFIALCDVDWVKFLGERSGSTSTFNIIDKGTDDSAGFSMGSGGCQFGLSERVDHIWVEGMSFETFLIRGADQITFKDNDIAAGKTEDFDETNFVSNGYDGSYRDNYTTDLTFLDNDIHNFTSDECDPVNDCHIECMTGEFENLVMKRNRVWECGNTAGVIFGQDGGFSTKGTGNLLENNMIHDAENIPFQIGDTESGSVITIRFNTIRNDGGAGSATTDALGGSIAGTVNFVGNVLDGSNGISCGTLNGTFAYNEIKSGGSGCGTGGTGNNFSATTSFTGAVPDFHLAAGQDAIDKVPDATCTTTDDLDGDPRPDGSPCDAGADERTP